ncbi:MAG: FHA domain-containing protein [Clostridia bacterium]|nr:FHA domain-containing protein [Clostridia bacterium]
MAAKKENYLIILEGNGVIREIDLNALRQERISFGRDSTNPIVLNSPIVSKHHGVFQFFKGSLIIYDTRSTNGIYVNDKYLRTEANGETPIFKLHDGDIIRIDSRNLINGHSKGVMMYYTTVKTPGGWKKTNISNINSLTIGRDKKSDIYLESVKVSRRHAAIVHKSGGCYIQDLKSANGIFVNGQRVITEKRLKERDIIYIANSMFIYTAETLLYKTDTGGTRVVMQNISRTVKVKGKPKKILDSVNLTVEPNEFVAIIGGSGAGKSTVMNAMSGFEQATEGCVMVNNVDLYKNYQVLKNIIGYVPQQDIIYENITLQKMLEYSAQMRISDDVSKAERMQRINDVLNMVDLTEHRDKFIRSLSGGQKKRASIAVEMLADPGLFFLDEPTSGLDPGTEATLMKTLNRLSKQRGKTIIMVTHTTQNLHLCDKILFMGVGGKVCFYGTPGECMDFFGVNNLTEIYNKVLDPQAAAYWAHRYVTEYGYNSDTKSGASGSVKDKKVSIIKQFGILSARYMTLIKNDIQRLLMIFIQPVLIAILIAAVAKDDVFTDYSSTRSILFAVSCAGIWVGLFSSIQEICKERSILKREYMANLRLGAYVLSKFVVQLLLSAIQALIMVSMLYMTIGHSDYELITESGYFEMFVTMFFTVFSSASIGLIVSALSKNNDKAMTVAPFLLIVQLLFSGILFELDGITEKISYLTVSRWSVSAFGSIANLNELASGIPEREVESIYEFSVSNLTRSWTILSAFVVVCFVASMIILRNVKNDSR